MLTGRSFSAMTALLWLATACAAPSTGGGSGTAAPLSSGTDAGGSVSSDGATTGGTGGSADGLLAVETVNSADTGGGQGTACGNGKCEAGENTASCAKDCPAVGGTDASTGGGTTDTGSSKADTGASTGGGHYCDSHCGQKAPSGCYCDKQCGQYGDCCSADGAAPSKSTPINSCSGSTCGDCNGAPPPKPVCGNGNCEAGESNANCPKDCPTTGGGTGSHWCDSHCTNDKQPSGCYCDAQCAQYGDCCNADGSVPSKSSPNKSCAGSTCTACNGTGGTGGGGAVCGNGTCDAGETTANCAKDCPPSGGGGGTCTTYADVQPIFQSKCGKCHGFGGGCSAASKYFKINAEVQSGAMPPGGGLSAEDKAKIAAWAAAKNACTTAQCP